MVKESPESRLWALARSQRGVFTRSQALGAGLSGGGMARTIAKGSLTRVLPRVYRAAATPESFNLMLMAACLWAGPGAVVSHVTAARLYGLEGLAPRRLRERIELSAPGRRIRVPGFFVHGSNRLEPADRSTIDGIPVTSLARTLVDLAAVLDERHLAVALDSGLARHRNIDPRVVRRTLDRLRSQGRTGVGVLDRLLDQRTRAAVHLDSALERRFHTALRRAGLPQPICHYDVVHNGRHVAELDFAYPRERLGIEVNGAGIHRRYDVWERDQQRLSELAAAGWRIVLVTWAQLEADEAAVMDRVARALGRTDK